MKMEIYYYLCGCNQVGWQSGRMRWTRNPVYPHGYRGFESLSHRSEAEYHKGTPLFFYQGQFFCYFRNNQYLSSINGKQMAPPK